MSVKHQKNIYPSLYTKNTLRYKSWCSVSYCPGCLTVGKYEDLHPAEPCPNCGNGRPIATVGRWRDIKIGRWWQFWRWGGCWELHPKSEALKCQQG